MSTTRIPPVRRHTSAPRPHTTTTPFPTTPLDEPEDIEYTDFTSTTEESHWWQIFKQSMDEENSKYLHNDDSAKIRYKHLRKSPKNIPMVKRSSDDENDEKISHSKNNIFRKSVPKADILS